MTLFVLGNAAVDAIYQVPALPRPGETLLAIGEREDLGGKGLNQAVIAHRTGADVRFWSAIGDDTAGARITALLHDEGIDPATVRRKPGATDRSIIFVAPSGENTIVSTAAMARTLGNDDIRRLATAMAAGDHLLLQGNLPHDVTRAAMTAASAAGAPVLINPAPIDFDYAGILPLADILIVNEVESRTLSGHAGVGDAAAALLAAGVGTVVITRGAAGAVLAAAGTTTEFAAPAVTAVDTAGAGDVFCGVLAGAVAQGMAVAQACSWAVAAAAIAVTRPGTSSAFPDAAELAACRSEG